MTSSKWRCSEKGRPDNRGGLFSTVYVAKRMRNLHDLLLLQPFRRRYQQSTLRVLFIMLAGIQAFFFFFPADAQRNDEVDEFEDQPGYGEAVNNGNGHCFQLDKE